MRKFGISSDQENIALKNFHTKRVPPGEFPRKGKSPKEKSLPCITPALTIPAHE